MNTRYQCDLCSHQFIADSDPTNVVCPKCESTAPMPVSPAKAAQRFESPVIRHAQVSDDRKSIAAAAAMRVVITDVEIPAATIIRITLIALITCSVVAAILWFIIGIAYGILH